MRPKILISYKTKGQSYVDAVERCGGDCIGGYLPRYDASADGLLLCGGSDIDPAIYESSAGGSRNVDRERDDCELELVKMALGDGKPVFGICRGCQLINVYFGGSLIEDLSSADRHTSLDPKGISHTVINEENSIVGRLYGKTLITNSFHHQAVDRLGDGLRATETEVETGVIEAIEHSSLPVFGVQWHPERMFKASGFSVEENGAEIIEYFIGLCKGGAYK